ncbi:MAG: hypothetical protein LQ341_007310, partial [Variospora aurantia]
MKSFADSTELSLFTVEEIRSIRLSGTTRSIIQKLSRFPRNNPPAELDTSPKSPTTPGESTRRSRSTVEKGEHNATLRCPVAREFQQARDHHPILASTGCSKDFCQAGRAVHTDEPRIGENRTIETVEKEAEGFLRELLQEGFFETEEAFTNRLADVLGEIRKGAREGAIRGSRHHETVGGNWLQTPAELEFGIRRSWRNARKCIMRSHCEEL